MTINVQQAERLVSAIVALEHQIESVLEELRGPAPFLAGLFCASLGTIVTVRSCLEDALERGGTLRLASVRR